MAEGEHNPGEPPLKDIVEEKRQNTFEECQERVKPEELKWNPDIQVDVKGSENSTIETSTVIGVVINGDVGAKYYDGGKKTEGVQNPDQPPPKKESSETKAQSCHINVTAKGPTDSTVGTSIVIGHVCGNVAFQHDHQREVLEATRKKIAIRTEGMIHVSTVALLFDKLKSCNKWITITGNPGDGKTTLGHLVLKKFVDKMNVYVIETPEEYHHISQVQEDRVILLNDIFGAFTFDSTSVNKWRDVVTDIFDIQMKRPDSVTKVVFVSRKPILQEVKDHLEQYGQMVTDEQNVFDVSQVKKEAERLQILECHLERKGITIPDWDKRRVANIDTAHGFPHCCEMYAELVSREHINIGVVDFFKSPLKFLDKTTKILFQNDYRDLFITLVKNDGKFCTDSVEDDDKRWTLEEKAKLQEGSYLANYEGCWVFRHPSIYESVLSVVAEKDPLLFVRYASMLVLRQKVKIKTSGSDTTTCFILLEPKPRVLDALARRFIKLLQNGYIIFIQDNLCRNEEFCETLIRKVTQNEHELINQNDSTGSTMLHYATRISNFTAMKSLLNHGADINLGDNRNMSCLSIYICDTDLIQNEILQFLLEKGADVNHADVYGKVPLHFLCEQSSVNAEVVQALIKSGADINHADNRGMTPLTYQCNKQGVSVETLQLLISNGADINHVDRFMMTPFLVLCNNAIVSDEALRLLITNGAEVNTALKFLFRNVFRLGVETLEFVINSGADVNALDDLGQTPLHLLCGKCDVFEPVDGNHEYMETLIRAGSDVNRSDDNGNTPILRLCLSYLRMLTLIKAGRDVHRSDEDGNTSYDWLCLSFRRLSMLSQHPPYLFGGLRLLIAGGADVNKRNHDGDKPIDILRRGCPDLTEGLGDFTEALELLTNGIDDVSILSS